VVSEVGSAVEGWRAGDEVVIDPSTSCGHCRECVSGEIVYCDHFGILGEHRWGAFADEVVVPDVNIHARPSNLSWEQAAAYPLTYVTAWRMLTRAGLRAGHDMLVVGAGSGVSTACISLGVAAGARVIATSRSEAKRAAARDLGAAEVVDSAGFVEQVKALTGGRGVDVAVDHVGPATLAQSLAATAKGGSIAICGATSGTTMELSIPRLFFRQHRVVGSTMGTHEEFAQVTAMVSAGLAAPPPIDSTFALADLGDALRRLESESQFGKVVLVHQ
jgi:NADPH:quinone reductase-like Zn-dependent oxidoreductase